MSEAVVISMREVAMDFTRPTQATHKEIQYTIDGKGPFSLFVPLAEWTEQRMTQMLQDRVNEWGRVVGKSIKSG